MTTCRQCDLLIAAGEIPARCGDCGAELRRAPSRSRRVGEVGMLRDLIELREHFARQTGARSNSAIALDAARTGIVGLGCAGSKGAGAHVVPEPQPTRTRESTLVALARYRALDHLPGHAARALIVAGTVRGDGAEPLGRVRGHADVALAVAVRDHIVVSGGKAPKVIEVSLEQALGWHLTADRAAWRIKLATRDASPALAAMARVGTAALERAVREWGS